MKTLIIDRRRWLRGDSDSWLKRDILRDRGVPEENILNFSTPVECYEERKCNLKQATWLLDSRKKYSEDTLNLIEINDDDRMEDEQRETEIKEIFAKHKVKVIFRN